MQGGFAVRAVLEAERRTKADRGALRNTGEWNTQENKANQQQHCSDHDSITWPTPNKGPYLDLDPFHHFKMLPENNTKHTAAYIWK